MALKNEYYNSINCAGIVFVTKSGRSLYFIELFAGNMTYKSVFLSISLKRNINVIIFFKIKIGDNEND